MHTSPSSFMHVQAQLPEQLKGSTLLSWHWRHWDAATHVYPHVRVKACSCISHSRRLRAQ